MFTRLPRSRLFSTESLKPLKVINDVSRKQFTVTTGGESAIIGYELRGKELRLTHTEVPPVCLGRGAGAVLAKHAFDHAKKNKLDVTCECHFLAKYYLRNQDEYKSIRVKINEGPKDVK